MTYCITGDYVLEGHEIFDDLSDNVKNLIQGILRVDPFERFDFETIKNHPWVKKNNSLMKISSSSFKSAKFESLQELE